LAKGPYSARLIVAVASSGFAATDGKATVAAPRSYEGRAKSEGTSALFLGRRLRRGASAHDLDRDRDLGMVRGDSGGADGEIVASVPDCVQLDEEPAALLTEPGPANAGELAQLELQLVQVHGCGSFFDA
jgi:hypothetical protein